MTLTEATTWTVIIFAMIVVGCLLGILLINHVAGDKRDVHLGHMGICALFGLLGFFAMIMVWVSQDSTASTDCKLTVASQLKFDEDTVTAITRDDLINSICS